MFYQLLYNDYAANAPDNWWKNNDKGGGQKQQQQQPEEEEEVVDFQMMMDQNNHKRKHEESSCSQDEGASEDDSDATKELDLSNQLREDASVELVHEDAQGGGERKSAISFDQSLFSMDGTRSANFNQKSAAPPEFSCSPIAMQSSQPAFSGDDDGRHTATASQLDRVLMSSVKKNDDVEANVQLRQKAQSKRESVSNKKQHTAVVTSAKKPPIPSALAKGPSPKRSTRVSFQQQPRVMLLNPSWTLTNAHTRCLRKCVNDGFIAMLKSTTDSDNFESEDQFDSGFDFDTEEGREYFLAMLSSNRTDNCPPAPLSFYAISTEKDNDFSFGDAIIVPRSFQYYLAVACGLPIVDIEFQTSAASMKRKGTMSHQRYPFPSLPGEDERKRGRKNSQKEFLVLGATNYTWESPKKAQAAALERHSLWQKEEGPHAQLETLLPGTDLLSEYSIVLVGDFDQPNHSKRAAAKRKKQRDSEMKGGGYCTRGNLSLLLQLCGANVYDIESVATMKQIKKGLSEDQLDGVVNVTPLGSSDGGTTLNEALQSTSGGAHSKTFVMVKDKHDAKVGSEFINMLKSTLAENKLSEIHVVSCQWLLDSIGEFGVQITSKYNN